MTAVVPIGAACFLLGGALGALIAWLAARAQHAALSATLEHTQRNGANVVEALLERGKTNCATRPRCAPGNASASWSRRSRRTQRVRSASRRVAGPHRQTGERRRAVEYPDLHTRNGFAQSRLARSLGRDAVAQRRREGRDAGVLRFLGTADGRAGRSARASGHDGQSSRRAFRLRRREGAYRLHAGRDGSRGRHRAQVAGAPTCQSVARPCRWIGAPWLSDRKRLRRFRRDVRGR